MHARWGGTEGETDTTTTIRVLSFPPATPFRVLTQQPLPLILLLYDALQQPNILDRLAQDGALVGLCRVGWSVQDGLCARRLARPELRHEDREFLYLFVDVVASPSFHCAFVSRHVSNYNKRTLFARTIPALCEYLRIAFFSATVETSFLEDSEVRGWVVVLGVLP